MAIVIGDMSACALAFRWHETGARESPPRVCLATDFVEEVLEQIGGFRAVGFVPNLDRHLAACDLALVQGSLTTCMELTAAGTQFLYFPLKNHFERNFHVAHRLDRYGAGGRMELATSTPDMIAEAMIATLQAPTRFKPVEINGAVRAARMLAELS
jgi:predicted glycosyltransferase